MARDSWLRNDTNHEADEGLRHDCSLSYSTPFRVGIVTDPWALPSWLKNLVAAADRVSSEESRSLRDEEFPQT